MLKIQIQFNLFQYHPFLSHCGIIEGKVDKEFEKNYTSVIETYSKFQKKIQTVNVTAPITFPIIPKGWHHYRGMTSYISFSKAFIHTFLWFTIQIVQILEGQMYHIYHSLHIFNIARSDWCKSGWHSLYVLALWKVHVCVFHTSNQ